MVLQDQKRTDCIHILVTFSRRPTSAKHKKMAEKALFNRAIYINEFIVKLGYPRDPKSMKLRRSLVYIMPYSDELNKDHKLLKCRRQFEIASGICCFCSPNFLPPQILHHLKKHEIMRFLNHSVFCCFVCNRLVLCVNFVGFCRLLRPKPKCHQRRRQNCQCGEADWQKALLPPRIAGFDSQINTTEI